MKKAVIALSPRQDLDENLDHFYDTLKLFQDKGFFADTAVVSVIHPLAYLMPMQWYKDMRGRLAKEAHQDLEKRVQQRIHYQTIKVLQSSTDSLEYLASMVSRYAQRIGSDVLVLASNARTGLPHWIMGSFSETAALLARHPTLIIKPHIPPEQFASAPHMVVCVDVIAPPSAQELRWIATAAKTGGATLDLLYVKPKPRPLFAAMQPGKTPKDPQKVLDDAQKKLEKAGVSVRSSILDEGSSLAQTVVDFAEQKQTWAIFTVATPRSTLRKLLLGSQARKILALTQRPFLSLRLE
jgi:nucleotide-binding universal stress UspA family protein